jgi:hypothetical protein
MKLDCIVRVLHGGFVDTPPSRLARSVAHPLLPMLHTTTRMSFRLQASRVPVGGPIESQETAGILEMQLITIVLSDELH